jgi:hypothetical protein
VPVKLDGWDNTTFRLGDELSVRLPSGDDYVAQVGKEHRWLPVLARYLPRPIPVPVAMGRPGNGFSRPWSVYRWIEGEPATARQIADLAGFAEDLAGFLAALYARCGPGQHLGAEARMGARGRDRLEPARRGPGTERGHRLRVLGRGGPGLRPGHGVDVLHR